MSATSNILPYTITLNGISFDNPLESDFPLKLRFFTEQVGARKSIKTIWVDIYGEKEYTTIPLTLSNSGIAELNGKRITKTEEINIVHQIFDELNKRNKQNG
jgi:hypothetical protein